MQLIAEIYDILKELANLSNPQMADVFTSWNEGEINTLSWWLNILIKKILSFFPKIIIFWIFFFFTEELEIYLIEITAIILRKEDDQSPLADDKDNDKDVTSSDDDAEDDIRYSKHLFFTVLDDILYRIVFYCANWRLLCFLSSLITHTCTLSLSV